MSTGKKTAVLRCEGLSKSFDGVRALAGVILEANTRKGFRATLMALS